MSPDAALVLTGATLWLGPQPTPRAGWLVLRDGRVAAVGAPDVPPPPDARVVDLAGRHVLPGFVDAHTHLATSAFLPAAGDGRAWRSRADALAAVARAAAGVAPDAWLLFLRLDLDAVVDAPPTAVDLEQAGGGRPVLLADVTLHRGVLSESGMRAAGLLATAPDPLGELVRGRGGAPTGLVWERAFGRALFAAVRGVAAVLADGGLDALLDAEATRHLALGITRAHEPGVPPDLAARLRALAGRTPLRLSWSATSTHGLLEPPEAALDDCGEGPPAVKLFLDGAHRCALCLPAAAVATAAWRAGRAALLERDPRPLVALAADPLRVVGAHVHVPWLRLDDATLAAHVERHLAAGRRLRIHALGNLAVAQAVHALGGHGRAASIEHLLGLADADCDAVAAAGAVASLQPGFLPHYGPTMAARGLLGPLRAVPLASLAARGVPIAISSDNPCGPLDPLHNLRRAVDRADATGTPIDAREAIRVGAALRAATIGGTLAIGLPEPAGILPGEPADLAVCDGDPLAEATRVVETWVGGRRAWAAA